MPIQTIYDVGDDYQINPKMDGGVYRAGIADAVCGGIADEFDITYSANSLDVSFSAGCEAVVCGSFFKITGNDAVSVTLPANKTFYLCARIDLSRANGSRGYLACIEGSANLYTSSNINGSDTIHDLVLYQITTSSSGVTSVTDKRVIQSGSGVSVGGYSIVVCTQAQYNSGTKDASTLYFIY